MVVIIRRICNALASSAALVILLSPAARADMLMTRFTTYMHAGPGKQFAVSDEIPTQRQIEVAGCANDWCEVRYGAAYGWVETSALSTSPPTAEVRAGERPSDCFDFARTGWPDRGRLQSVCIYSPRPGSLEAGGAAK